MDVWVDPCATFYYRLKSQRLDEYLADKVFLASLRHNWKEVRHLADLFKEQLLDRKLELEEEVFRASLLPDPTNIDAEDEQKQACLLPESTEGWVALQDHREELASSKKNDTQLPPVLVDMVYEFRGARPTVKQKFEDEEPQDPWQSPVAVEPVPFLRVI